MATKVSVTKDQLRGRYTELVLQNPLLGRIEGQCKTVYWTDEEIRTLQLIVAVESNASLQTRLKELEVSLGKPL